MALSNAPIKYEYEEMPEGWVYVTDRQVFSQSDSTTVTYNTPKYKGEINWCYSYIYGDLATRFDFEGKTLYASNGESLCKSLNIPEDYCIRTGKDGWMKLLQREYFEMWLRKP